MTELSQQAIIEQLNVKPIIDAETETHKRIDFIKQYILQTRVSCLVLGISGGIDSTVTGRLCQLAVEQLRSMYYKAHFIAVRLPYGQQKDEKEAEQALAFIQADELMTLDIKPAADAIMNALLAQHLAFDSPYHQDFVLGNIKARQRMVMQYAIAGAKAGLVVGTDHAAEALMGFFTKFGDGASDIMPLSGLTKRQVRQLAGFLRVPANLIHKIPTADLETLQPLKPDEQALGVTYDEIDDFLEAKPVCAKAAHIIQQTFSKTAHKRALPKGFV